MPMLVFLQPNRSTSLLGPLADGDEHGFCVVSLFAMDLPQRRTAPCRLAQLWDVPVHSRARARDAIRPPLQIRRPSAAHRLWGRGVHNVAG
ncbi:hypothetical protein T492DRAFT_1108270 [Pavlovales sp. CCMP2436]|nr:hypothetical protein T492DRAFT_1108270 [Pavlovales sp. CCMP2436]